MTILGVPLGQIVSFGSSNYPETPGDRLIFSGAGTPVSASAGNEAPRWSIKTITARDHAAGKLFSVSKSGMGPRPVNSAVITWRYWLAATDRLNQDASWADLESRLQQMQAWYQGTYDYTIATGVTTYAGTAGDYGDLAVLDAGGTLRFARAQWVNFPDDIPLGQVSFYECDLSFRLLSQWAYAPDLWIWDHAIWDVSVLG